MEFNFIISFVYVIVPFKDFLEVTKWKQSKAGKLKKYELKPK